MNWRSIWRSKQRAAEIVQEIETHIAHDAEEMMARGVPPDQAMLRARRRLGNQTTLREAVHEMGTSATLEGWWRDIRHSARLLRLKPWFAMAAVLSLALGIGANSAIFGLLNAIRVRSLPVSNAGELVSLQVEGDGRVGRQTGRNRQVSWPLWQEIAKYQQSFSALASFGDTRFNLAPRGEVRYVEGLWVSGSFFTMLGVAPVMGRVFTPEEDRPGCGYFGAVVSHAFWQRELGGRADAIGQPLTIGTDRAPVIGVTPERFFGVEVGRRFDVALPICSAGFGNRNHFWLGVIGK